MVLSLKITERGILTFPTLTVNLFISFWVLCKLSGGHSGQLIALLTFTPCTTFIGNHLTCTETKQTFFWLSFGIFMTFMNSVFLYISGNLNLLWIMWLLFLFLVTLSNIGLEETQAGIKIARRNINTLRYADDTTIMAESEELNASWWKWKRRAKELA